MKIIWWRILLAGITAQFLYGLFLTLVLGDTQKAFSFFGYVSLILLMMAGGSWIGLKASNHKVSQALLVGVVAIIFYEILSVVRSIGMDQPLSELFERHTQSHYLLHDSIKVASAACGGAVVKYFLKAKELTK